MGTGSRGLFRPSHCWVMATVVLGTAEPTAMQWAGLEQETPVK